MEPARTSQSLVRCLDCGTVYEQPSAQDESAPCPTCGYVGWITVAPGDEPPAAGDS